MLQRIELLRLMMKKAVIMAAGDSTRMLPLSANVPKHLLPVAGRPLIFHTLDALQKAGITETLVIYGYHGEKLREAIEAQQWKNMEISFVLQKERQGTAHAAGHAEGFVGADDALLMNGDIMLGPDSFEGLVSYHEAADYELTVSVRPVEDPTAYGIVEVQNGKAVKMIEKPKREELVSNLVNAGFYIIGESIWEAIRNTRPSARGELEITDSIEMIIEKGNVGAFTLPSWWIDIGKPWDLLEANKLVLGNAKKRIDGTVENGAVIKGETIVEKGAIVKSGAYIEGPAYIGTDCTIGPNCYIRAYTSLGHKVKIGNAVEIKNCIIMDETNVGHLSYVGDSILGRNCNFGAGTITANLRHDDQAINATVRGERVSSGRRKLGSIIGDNVKTGIGTSIAPGVVIHQGARTGIGVIVGRDIEPNKLLIAEQKQKIIEIDSE